MRVSDNQKFKGIRILNVTATDLARNFRAFLNRVEYGREELVIIRNQHAVGRIVPGPAVGNALEVMADIYRTLPEDAARDWLADSQPQDAGLEREIEDPWHT